MAHRGIVTRAGADPSGRSAVRGGFGLPPGRRQAAIAAHPVVAPLLGEDAALVVLSPGGRYLAYHSWERPIGETVVPLLYVHDTVTGRDRLLARGAQTVAWNRDGRIAYFRARRARYDGRVGAYVGDVVVGRLDEAPRAWTTHAGAYQVLAWARDRLLVAVENCFFPNCRRDPARGVYVLDHSGALRPLPIATLAALSPHGRYAVGRYDPVAIKAGAWRGQEIVVSFGGRDAVLVFLRMHGRLLEVESVARIPPQTLKTRYGIAFGVPFFTSETNVVVPIRGEKLSGRYVVAVVACSRRTHRCVQGQTLPPLRWFAIAENRSRPIDRS